jgi:hypothetical protein
MLPRYIEAATQALNFVTGRKITNDSRAIHTGIFQFARRGRFMS